MLILQPKIRMYSKYERRTDIRTYEDRKKLYEGVRLAELVRVDPVMPSGLGNSLLRNSGKRLERKNRRI